MRPTPALPTEELLSELVAFDMTNEKSDRHLVESVRRYPSSYVTKIASARTGTDTLLTMPFGTEAGHFESAGIPAVSCGPGPMDQAHEADEYIEIARLKRCEQFLGDCARR